MVLSDIWSCLEHSDSFYYTIAAPSVHHNTCTASNSNYFSISVRTILFIFIRLSLVV